MAGVEVSVISAEHNLQGPINKTCCLIRLT